MAICALAICAKEGTSTSRRKRHGRPRPSTHAIKQAEEASLLGEPPRSGKPFQLRVVRGAAVRLRRIDRADASVEVASASRAQNTTAACRRPVGPPHVLNTRGKPGLNVPVIIQTGGAGLRNSAPREAKGQGPLAGRQSEKTGLVEFPMG
jgi:NADH:ubiquinone oxidoreductase subunit F (NADH-binding)